MRFAQAAALVERGEFQILRLDAQAGGDVVADEVEPGELLGREGCARLGLVHEPFVEPLGHGVGEGREHGLLFQREADEGDEVGEASGLRAALDLAGRGDGEGVPEAVLGPRGVVVAQFLLQFLEHRLGEALLVRAAVEDLQGVDLGLVLREVVAEGLDEAGGLRLRGFVEALGHHFVRRVDVDGLFRLRLQPRERFAERGCVEGGAGLGNQLLASGFVFFRRDFLRLSAGPAGGAFGNGVGIVGAQQRARECGGRLPIRRRWRSAGAVRVRARGRAGRGARPGW